VSKLIDANGFFPEVVDENNQCQMLEKLTKKKKERKIMNRVSEACGKT
jgi:hypothetical protein